MKKTVMVIALLVALLTALSTATYAATAVRPTTGLYGSNSIDTGVIVPATADYEVYLSGTYIYKISVADNKLLVDGTYAGLQPPYKALLDNIKHLVPADEYTALSYASTDKEMQDALAALPTELRKKLTVPLKIQLVKPVLYTNYYTGNDGLVRVIMSGLPLPKNNQSILTTTIPVVCSTAATDISNLKTLSLSLDLDGVDDGIYCIQELISDGTAAHQEGKFWDAVAVVIHNGVANLQIVEHMYGWATTKGGKAVNGFTTHNLSETTEAGKAVYGDYYPDWWYSSDWHLKIWAHGGWGD